MIGVFSMDPGGHTGLAWAVFEPELGDIADVLRKKQRFGSLTVEGDERVQILSITAAWQKFFHDCIYEVKLPPASVWFVAENYIYTSGNIYSGEDSAISTSLIWGVEGYRMGQADEWRRQMAGRRGVIAKTVRPPMVLQPAEQAMSYANNQRLKEWGLWVVGKEHERSACKHMAVFVRRYITQHVRS